MTYRNLLVPFALAVSVAACDNAADDSSSTRASNLAAGKTGDCLQQHDDNDTLDALLTKQDITAYVKSSAEGVKADYDKKYSHEISYKWPSDRTRTMRVSDRSVMMSVPNIVTLGGVKTYTERDYYARDENDPVKRFQRAHHNLTVEEKAKARAAMKEEMQKKGKKAGKLADAIIGSSSKITLDPVADVGDAAVWDRQAERLVVLTGETEFRVRAAVSGKTEKNQAVAKTLAQSILADCAGGK